MCEAYGAFVPSAARLPAPAARTRLPARAPTCGLRRNLDDVVPSHAAGSAVRSVGVAAAAALIVSSQCMHHALGQDNALVFDHDQTLVGADFTGRADLVNSIFSKSNCTRANFSGANLKNAQLDDTVLIEAILDDADCSNVLATKAKLSKSSLRNTIFTNANLIAAQLGGTDVTGADFTDALVDPATVAKLCKNASGTNSHTGVSTRESLMCIEE